MTDEQIKRYIPKATVEQGDNDELKKMKEEIAELKKEVAELKAWQRSPEKHNYDSGRGKPLISVDTMHEEKRKMHEEKLLKEHPDFKPSKRLKDSLTKVE